VLVGTHKFANSSYACINFLFCPVYYLNSFISIIDLKFLRYFQEMFHENCYHISYKYKPTYF